MNLLLLLLAIFFTTSQCGPFIQLKSSLDLHVQFIEDDGVVGPWELSLEGGKNFSYIYTYDVEINRSGVYKIYAQVSFITASKKLSFQIMSFVNGTSSEIGYCSESTTLRLRESPVTCSTEIVAPLSEGTKIFLSVEQRNIFISTKPTRTYVMIELIHFT
jgi:hypothetical protein